MKSRIQKTWRARLPELKVLGGLVTLYFLIAILSPVTQKTNLKWLLVVGVAVAILDVLLVATTSRDAEKGLVKKITDGVRENHEVILVLVLTVLFRFFMIGDALRWDAGEYYYRLGNACEKFDFSPITFLAEFRICNHPTLGMAFFASMGEFLFHRSPVGVHIVLLTMTIAALACLYVLFRDFLGKMTKKQAALGTLLCSCVPLFWGSFSYFNPDYFTLLFLIYMIYAEYKKQPLLIVFWGICVIQTKEPGIIVLFGYALLRLLVRFVTETGGWKNKIRMAWKDSVNWSMLVAGCSYLAYLLVVKLLGLTGWSQAPGSENLSNFRWTEDPWNCFGLDWNHIVGLLKQVFVLNFAWVLWLGISLCGVLWLINRKKDKAMIEQGRNCAGLIGAMLFYLMFMGLYVTFDIYRYHPVFVVGSAVMFVIAVSTVKKWWAFIMMFVLAAFGLQTFLPVDPVSNQIFTLVSTGRGKMLYTSSQEEIYYGDFLVNNYQYTWIDRVLDEFLVEIEYDEDTQIVLTPSELQGLMLNGNVGLYPQHWDCRAGKRTMEGLGGDVIEISTICVTQIDADFIIPENSSDVVVGPEAVRDKAVLLLLPYYEYDEELMVQVCSQYYEVGEKQVVRNRFGCLSYYPLVKK